MDIQNKRIKLVVVIELIIAAGFIIGADWASRETHIIFHSYFADIFLPFGFYFLLTLQGNKSKFFNTWWKRALAVFLLTATSETLQYFGIYALARVFDPLDYVMYLAGVLLAAYIDRKILTKRFNYWE